jgi:hypothetical protein
VSADPILVIRVAVQHRRRQDLDRRTRDAGETEIPGLTPGATVQFRYRTVTPKAGQGDWSQTVQLLIS